jgi:CRP-like cAMP-binding protein
MPYDEANARTENLGWTHRLVALRAVPGWADLPAADLALLASIAAPRRVDAGQTLVREGDSLGSIFVVVDGELAIHRDGGVAGRAVAHDIIGATAGLATDAASWSCVASRASVLLELPIEELEDVLEDRFSILLRWIEETAQRSIALRRGLGSTAGFASTTSLDATSEVPELALIERVWALRQNELLRTGRIDGLTSLARGAREIRLPEGGLLWTTGERADFIALVVSGTLRAATSDGHRFAFARNDLVGELETVSERPRWFDAVAERPTVLLALDRDRMLDIWEDHPDVGIEFLRGLSTALLRLPGSLP